MRNVCGDKVKYRCDIDTYIIIQRLKSATYRHTSITTDNIKHNRIVADPTTGLF